MFHLIINIIPFTFHALLIWSTKLQLIGELLDFLVLFLLISSSTFVGKCCKLLLSFFNSLNNVCFLKTTFKNICCNSKLNLCICFLESSWFMV